MSSSWTWIGTSCLCCAWPLVGSQQLCQFLAGLAWRSLSSDLTTLQTPVVSCQWNVTAKLSFINPWLLCAHRLPLWGQHSRWLVSTDQFTLESVHLTRRRVISWIPISRCACFARPYISFGSSTKRRLRSCGCLDGKWSCPMTFDLGKWWGSIFFKSESCVSWVYLCACHPRSFVEPKPRSWFKNQTGWILTATQRRINKWPGSINPVVWLRNWILYSTQQISMIPWLRTVVSKYWLFTSKLNSDLACCKLPRINVAFGFRDDTQHRGRKPSVQGGKSILD